MNERGQYGRHTRVSGPVAIEPRFAAMRRAVRAIFGLYNHARAPFYVYAEVNGIVDMSPSYSLDDVNARSGALERSIGEVYVAVFAVDDPSWPDPAYQTYRAAPLERVAVAAGASRVGAIVHTRTEFTEALNQINSGFVTLVSEFIVRMGGRPSDFVVSVAEMSRDPSAWVTKMQKAVATIKKSPLYNFWDTYLKTLYAEWNALYADPLTLVEALSGGAYGLGPFAWDKIEQWQKRLQAARTATDDMLSKTGKPKLESPGPAPLPKSWIDKGEEAAASVFSGIGDIGSILKYTLIGVLAIGGVVAVSSLASSLKKGKDPAEPYMGLGKRRRPRELPAPRARALPASARLALPPGEPAMEGS